MKVARELSNGQVVLNTSEIMKTVLAYCLLGLLLILSAALVYLMLWPRPHDTTAPWVFSGDGAALNYCDLPELDGIGSSADDIPKAYTPNCGYTQMPMPVLQECREPLSPGVPDMRGLWLAESGFMGHIERIEQCGNRMVVTTAGIIHDFRLDGTLKNGARDIQSSSALQSIGTHWPSAKLIVGVRHPVLWFESFYNL